MLASTMQISNNNPTNPRTPATRKLGRREDQKPHPTDCSARLILQDPTVCLTPPPPTRGLSNTTTANHKGPTMLMVDDSTSETPPCVPRHSPGIGVRAP
jgi:hypothetical protein